MSKFNYVATVIGSTSVDCSVVGRFCGDKLNLILGKGNRLEILEITDGSLSQFSEIQVYGRVTLLLLFRPDGEKTDLLFVATKSYKYFLLQWDDIKSKVITRASGQLPDLDRPCVKDPICIIDPGCTLIALYLFRNYIEVISCVQGQLRELDSKKLEHEAIDLKFLYGFTKPTIALLYKSSSDKEICYWLETLEIALVDKSCTSLVVPYSVKLSNKVKLLIPLPGPSYGGLIIGDKSILYLNDFISKLLETDNVRSTTKFYARLESGEGDDFRFLLVDKDGRLQLLLVNIVMGKCELKIDFIGETSVLPSTISSIGKEVVFIGSRSGDSQLMKLNSRSGLFLEALESFVNIGPILDFCVVEELEAERQGKRTIITCSGVKENASLRILRYGYMIQKMASVPLEDIMGLWSLRSTDGFEKFLVISFVSETWIFAMTAEEVLEETEIEGFSSGVRTYYSHDAAYEQMIQISSSAVRLICSISRKLLDIWEAPDFFINVATANMMQVLVAGRDILVYLEIGKGVLNMRKHEKKFNVSCLDITPVDEDSEYSKLAAVGMWNDTSTNTLSPRINILSLPTFQCLISVPLGEIVPRSLLLCAFEGIPYLLCGTGDGLLIKFLLDKRSGCLTEKTHLSLGSQPVSLLSFTCKAATLVVATSDKPSIIYISKRKLISSSLDLKEMTFMCSFNSASFPNSLAIAEEGKLSIYTVNYPELLI